MVAFEAVLGKKAYLEKKKVSKKKINKIDISEPVLLSPSTFKKHKYLLDVKKTLNSTDELTIISGGYDKNIVLNNKCEKETKKSADKKINKIKKKKKQKITNTSKSYDVENNGTLPNIIKDINGTTDDKICLTAYNGELKSDMNVINNINSPNNVLSYCEKDDLENSFSCKENRHNDEGNYDNGSDIKSQNYQESCRNNDFTNFLENKTIFSLSDISVEVEERQDLIRQYIMEKKELDEIMIRIIECDLNISEKEAEIENYRKDIDIQNFYSEYAAYNDEVEENQEDDEYNYICTELEGVKASLRDVTELTFMQRSEMSKNLAVLDKLDIDLKTKKALIVNLKEERISNNSLMAPKPLMKHSRNMHNEKDMKSFV